MRSATLSDETFEPREGFEAGQLDDAMVARVLYSPAVARWEVERGARPLADGSAINEQKVGSAEWLVGEILRYRGEAELLEPPELRARDRRSARSARRASSASTRLRAPASRLLDGQLEREGRALAGRRADVERAAVRLGDRAGDEEAEAGARLAEADVGPAELLEDQRLLVARDPGAAVLDRDAARGPLSARAYAPPPPRRPAST